MFPEAGTCSASTSLFPTSPYLKQNKRMVRAIVADARARGPHRRDPLHSWRSERPDLRHAIYAGAGAKKAGGARAAGVREIARSGARRDHRRSGPFKIEYLHVTHSTIDCVALAIRTPLGVIIHTGDYKIDPTPVDGKPFDLHAFARYGQEGVLALFSDSTNVERPGFTPSERAVVVRMEELFRAAPEKVVVSCFSQFDSSHPASDRRRARRGPQSRIRRPQHGG